MRNYILVLLLMISAKVFSCDCTIVSKYELRNSSYMKSEFVLIGKIIKVNDDNFIIRVLDTYKGKKEESLVIVKHTYCTISPKEDDIWLLYIEKKGDILYADKCMSSRNISKFSFISTENERDNTYISSQLSHNEELNWLLNKKYELTLLNKDSKENIEEITENVSDNPNNNILITILIIVNLIVLIFILFRTKSLKK